MPIQTQTGQVFDTAEDALRFIRICEDTMLDPGSNMMESTRATTDMLYTFRALDEYLRSSGGILPRSWAAAQRPFAVDADDGSPVT